MQIDQLNLDGYSNLDAWVTTLNERIDAVLIQRLQTAIDTWCREFSRSDEGVDGEIDQSAEEGSHGADLTIKPLVHEVRIRNQVIYLDPPIELARQEWLAQFQHVLGEYRCVR